MKATNSRCKIGFSNFTAVGTLNAGQPVDALCVCLENDCPAYNYLMVRQSDGWLQGILTRLPPRRGI
jgi:hypothetical protein